MELHEAEIGKCYVVAYGSSQHLIKWGAYTERDKDNEIISPHIYLNKNFKDFSKEGSFRFTDESLLRNCKLIRAATEDETIWLEACIESDTYISFETILNNKITSIDDILKKLNL